MAIYKDCEGEEYEVDTNAAYLVYYHRFRIYSFEDNYLYDNELWC